MTDPNDSITVTWEETLEEINIGLNALILTRYFSHHDRLNMAKYLTDTLFTNAKAREETKLARSKEHDAAVEKEMQDAWKHTNRLEPRADT